MNRAPASSAMVVALLGLGALAVPHPSAQTPAARSGAAWDTSYALSPRDPEYADAMALARILEGGSCGIHIEHIAPSMDRGFLGEPRAASYLTDRGNFSVVFFPAPDGAERVRISSEVRHGHYLYKFSTRQRGLRHMQRTDMDGPQWFVVHGRWFIFVWDGNTAATLKSALAGS